MTKKLLLWVALGVVGLTPLQVTADDLSVLQAEAAANAGRECQKSGDLQCAFENTHAALSSAAYIDALWKEESHFHLAEWEWYIRSAFDAADELAPAEKRSLIALAIDTVKNRPRQMREMDTTILDVLRAEACIALGDMACARESALRVANQEAIYRDQHSGPPVSTDDLVKWYTQHAADAPTDPEFRTRVDAVLAIVA